MSAFVSKTIELQQILALAGFRPGGDGRVALPNTQDAADALARATHEAMGWHPGDPRVDVTLTGPAPVWAYLVIAHALHGLCRTLTYASPVATIVVFRHDT